jgi:hypothetical protein
MMPFLALHSIAAQRGDGLRPELISLLERWRCSESDRTSPTSSGGACSVPPVSPGRMEPTGQGGAGSSPDSK